VRRLLLLTGSLALYNASFSVALSPLLPRLAERFALTKADAGLLVAAYGAGILAGAIPGGFLTVRIGARKAVIAGLGLHVVFGLVFAFAGTVWLLDLGRFGQGFANAVVWGATFSWAVGAAPRERRGEFIGLTTRGTFLGVLIGPVVGGTAALVGLTPTFTAASLVAVLLAAWAWASPGVAPVAAQPAKAFVAAARQPRVAAGLWFGSLTALLLGVLGVLAPLALDRAGWGTIGVSAVFLLAAAFQALWTPALGRWADERGRREPIRAGLVAAFLASAVLPWVQERWMLAAFVIVAAVSYGLFWVPGMAVLTDGIEAAGLRYGFGFALMNLAWAPGQSSLCLGTVVGLQLAGRRFPTAA